MESKPEATIDQKLVLELLASPTAPCTVHDLKTSLETHFGIYRGLFHVMHNKTKLSDTADLQSFEKTTLSVSLTEGPMVRITVEVWTCTKHFQLRFSPENGIAEVQEKIKEKFAIPIDQQVLQYNYATLPTVGTLKSAGIEHWGRLIVHPKKFNMRLKFPDGSEKSMEVNALQTVDELQERIKGLNPEYDTAIVHIGALKSGRTLGEENVDPAEVYHVTILPQVIGQLFIKTPTGHTLTLTVDLNETVYGVKRAIYYAEGYETEIQRLVFAGKQLDDFKLLTDYGVKKESTLDLTFRIKGC